MENTQTTTDWAELERRMAAEMLKAMNDPEFMPTIPEIAKRVEKFRARKAAEAADPETIRRNAERAELRATQDARWAAEGMVRCDRCGGAGGSSAWAGTGHNCYKCGGHGAVTR